MFTLHDYPSHGALTMAACAFILPYLADSLAEKRRASMALSGGSSPRPLYQALSHAELDWSEIDATLVDERWVSRGQAGSNEDFLHDSLICNKAASLRLTGLKTDAETPSEGLAEAEARLDGLRWPLDIAVLGMGPDGHTASWFPYAQGLDAALSEYGPRLAAVTAQHSEVTGAHVQRITLTLAALAKSGLLLLLIQGDAKRRALEQAMETGPVEALPVRALLHHPRAHLHILACP